MKQQKESDRVTLWHVNKTYPWQSGNLIHSLLVHATKSLALISNACYDLASVPWPFWSSSDLITLSSSESGRPHRDGSGFFLENFSQYHPCLPPENAKFLFCLACPSSSCLTFEHSSTKMGSLDIGPVYSTLCPRIKSTRSTSKFHLNMFQYSVGGAVMPDAIAYGQTVLDERAWGETFGARLTTNYIRMGSCVFVDRNLAHKWKSRTQLLGPEMGSKALRCNMCVKCEIWTDMFE